MFRSATSERSNRSRINRPAFAATTAFILACPALAAPVPERVQAAEVNAAAGSTGGDGATLTIRGTSEHDIIVELVEAGGAVHAIRADVITIESQAGEPTGSLVLESDGTVRITDPPQDTPQVQIGVTMESVSEALAAQLAVDSARALLVAEVIDGLAAHRAGVLRFDVITHIDGEAPATQARLRDAVGRKTPGQALKLRLLRAGKPLEVEIIVAAYQELKTQPLSAYLHSVNAIELAAKRVHLELAVPILLERSFPVIRHDLVLAPQLTPRLELQVRPTLTMVPVPSPAREPDEKELHRKLRAELEALKEQVARIEGLLEEWAEAVAD